MHTCSARSLTPSTSFSRLVRSRSISDRTYVCACVCEYSCVYECVYKYSTLLPMYVHVCEYSCVCVCEYVCMNTARPWTPSTSFSSLVGSRSISDWTFVCTFVYECIHIHIFLNTQTKTIHSAVHTQSFLYAYIRVHVYEEHLPRLKPQLYAPILFYL
jgi:hypothetical protein